MIDGVRLSPLKIIPDPRGNIMHMIKENTSGFAGFGEMYFTCINSGAVKAWRKHSRATMQLCVPVGLVKIVLYDDRNDSASQDVFHELILGPGSTETYQLLIVPPGVWNGFLGVDPAPSIVANCSSIPHDPEEAVRKDFDDPSIPYDWGSI